MIYCFDIDGTICSPTGGDYSAAEPYPERLAEVNRLYDAGHEIIFFTARGSTTGLNLYDLTMAQLLGWGVRFHRLIMGKPHAHVFIDDLAVNSEDFGWGQSFPTAETALPAPERRRPDH